MSISPGDKLGPYEILSQLGAGGMGEVYRARDTKLGREVAIRVLPDAFANDIERLARFEREARLLASLNHPNIATIHGLEQSGDARFLVMELVPGETLADRIKKGALPLEDALPLFMQIAEGLEAAHEKGVVHRDLKPANIKLTPDDKVKVLDFGLAKAALGTPSGDSSESPTIPHAGTEAGTILGTAGDMSPEQARGKTVDKRTDIWALGCCLYEALTGQITFQGDTLSDTIASVLRQDPDWEALPETTPRTVRRLLERCLQKDPRRRFRDAWDVRVELEEALSEPPRTQAIAVRRPSVLRWIALWVAVSLVAGAVVWRLLPPRTTPPQPVTRLTLSTPQLAEFRPGLDISPDGTRLVFVAEENGVRKLYLRPMDQLHARPIDGSEGAYGAAFSPDGEWIVFCDANQRLKKVQVRGGTPLTLSVLERSQVRSGWDWAPDDKIYFRSRTGTAISRISSAGGDPEDLTEAREGERGHMWPEVLPDGKGVLFTAGNTHSEWMDRAHVRVASLEDGRSRTLIEAGGFDARYVPTGHLVYGHEGELRAIPFDLERLAVAGSPITVLDGAQFAFSDNGTLVYVPGQGGGLPLTRLVWINRGGRVQPIGDIRNAYFPKISPDGRKIAFIRKQDANSDIWVYDIARGTVSRLTVSPSDEEHHIWSPDGKRIVFYSNRDPETSVNLYWRLVDGSVPTERLTKTDQNQVPRAWSPDGRVLAVDVKYGIWMFPIEGERTPRLFLDTPFQEVAGEFSPDASGSRTRLTSPVAPKSTCVPTQARAAGGRSRRKAAGSLAGRPMVERFSTSTETN